MTLKRKFNLGIVALTLVALLLLVGVLMLGKTARLHYLERQHLHYISEVRTDVQRVLDGGRGAGTVRRSELIANLDRCIGIAGGVGGEMSRLEQFLFRAMGFNAVFDLPEADLVVVQRLRNILQGANGEHVSLEVANAMASDIARAYQLAERFSPKVQEAALVVRRVVLTLNMVAFVALVSLLMLMKRSTLGRLDDALDAARKIAAGDLTGKAAMHDKDELGQLCAAMDSMRQSLAGVVSEVRERSIDVARNAADVASGSGRLSSRTEIQAVTLQETAAHLSLVNRSMRDVGAQLGDAEIRAQQARELASAGGEAVNVVTQRMEEILSASRRIVDITGVVDGIAFQTNVLALNAAVEAARAGEHGRGFAVVAGEVRQLARRSAEASREIAKLIGDTMTTVVSGAEEVGSAGATIKTVAASVDELSGLVTAVSTELASHGEGLDRIDEAMRRLDSTTTENAAMAEASVAACKAVRHQADQLVDSVDQFRLSEVPALR